MRFCNVGKLNGRRTNDRRYRAKRRAEARRCGESEKEKKEGEKERGGALWKATRDVDRKRGAELVRGRFFATPSDVARQRE